VFQNTSPCEHAKTYQPFCDLCHGSRRYNGRSLRANGPRGRVRGRYCYPSTSPRVVLKFFTPALFDEPKVRRYTSSLTRFCRGRPSRSCRYSSRHYRRLSSTSYHVRLLSISTPPVIRSYPRIIYCHYLFVDFLSNVVI